MTTISDIANKSNRKLYMNHLSSLAKLREARLRIELLEGILKRAVDGYNQAYCRDEVNFDWVKDAESALGGENDKA